MSIQDFKEQIIKLNSLQAVRQVVIKNYITAVIKINLLSRSFFLINKFNFSQRGLDRHKGFNLVIFVILIFLIALRVLFVVGRPREESSLEDADGGRCTIAAEPQSNELDEHVEIFSLPSFDDNISK